MDWMSFSPLWGLLLLAPWAWAIRTTLVDRPRLMWWLAIAMRFGAMLFLLMALCRPFGHGQTENRHRNYLVDISASVSLEEMEEVVASIEADIEAMAAGDSWSLFTFGNHLSPTDPEKLRQLLREWKDIGSDETLRSATKLESALSTARLAYPANKAREMVVVSDGKNTDDLAASIFKDMAEDDIRLWFRPMASLQTPEVSIEGLQPDRRHGHHGESLRLRTQLRSNVDGPVVVRLLHQGVLEGERKVTLVAGQARELVFDTIVRSHGSASYQVEVVAPEDHFLENNQANCTIEVKGKARVLVLHRKTGELRALSRALSIQGILLDLRGPKGLPFDVEGLLSFEAVVLSDMAATDMTQRQMEAIRSYVTDFGGGLLMMGSENSFGLGGYYRTPVEEVLPLTSRYEKEKEHPSLAISYVIDKSGSMSGINIQMAKIAAQSSIELLGPRDQVAIVAFDGAPFVISPMTPATNKGMLFEAIEGLQADGGTDMAPGMRLAMELLQEATAKNKHMIVLGDGMSTPGPFASLASDMAASGITLTTVALGTGADAPLLKSLAEMGGGRFYQTLDPANIPSIFTRETIEASRSAIIEEPFEPIPLEVPPFLEGLPMSQLPFLLGHVKAKAKETAEVHLITDGGDPLLATSRYGLGHSAAFTSNMTDTWGGEWIHWNKVGQFWAQLFRHILRKEDSTGVQISHRMEDGQWVHRLTQWDASDRPVHGSQWKVTESGRTHDLRQTGLGVYEFKLPYRDEGASLLFHEGDGERKLTLVHPPSSPPEYRLDGEVLPDLEKAPSWDFDGKVSVQMATVRNPWDLPFIAMAMILSLLGILFRRI